MKQIITVTLLTLSIVLLAVLCTVLATQSIDFGLFKIYDVAGMKDLDEREVKAQQDLSNALSKKQEQQDMLEGKKQAFANAKAEYDKITDEDIAEIKEAFKEKTYYIEWLWIVIGNYASKNDLELTVIEPEASSEGTVKITVTGRYPKIVDFVFEVETDNELGFKLDNMEITYATDNKVTAIFDVLDMLVLKSDLGG